MAPTRTRFREAGAIFALCLSVAGNALFAGGVLVFPLLAPELAARLNLTQPQLSTIVLAGMAGQYPFSSIVGKVLDKYGPGVCSFAAAIMFSGAFGLSAMETFSPSNAAAQRLTLYFAMAGLGTVLSYFSFVFSASKTFANYLGVASGTSMALFGLSPLFLSYLAAAFFTDSETNRLDVTRFLTFLAWSSGVIHLISSYNLTIPLETATRAAHITAHASSSSVSDDEEISGEHTALLSKNANTDSPCDIRDGSIVDLLRDSQFWVLVVYLVVTLGTCEMVMSNVGTLTSSLPLSRTQFLGSENENRVSLQVRILSLSNTISRLLAGPLADFLSPIVSYVHADDLGVARKHRISRVMFLSGASLLIASSCAWMLFKTQTQQDLWATSIGIGVAYGTIFTVLPSITCSIWGMHNLARNFGVITYSPFVGTTIYSFLYALVVARHSEGSVCQGRICWQLTFSICFGTSLVALVLSLLLWRNWRGRL